MLSVSATHPASIETPKPAKSGSLPPGPIGTFAPFGPIGAVIRAAAWHGFRPLPGKDGTAAQADRRDNASTPLSADIATQLYISDMIGPKC